MPETNTANTRQITHAEAIREALEQAMAEDERVILIGEGVPDPKGIFGTTSGLKERFGASRVFDMPIAENGMTGICIGAAISGLRPVMVHQRIDFTLLCMDQLVNNAAKWRYMFAGQVSVPLVVRAIVGRGWGQGPQHAQSLQGLFAHVPGLKVVMPSSGHDAKGMLLAAIRDDNPVIFIEHRWLHGIADDVPTQPYTVPLDKAAIRRHGKDATVVAFSFMVVETLLAATALAELGIELEVIDARAVRPLDIATVIGSVKNSGVLIVIDTAWKTGGIAGELVASVTETVFGSLRRPPLRIALPDIPAPTSHHLSKDYYPDALHVARAIVSHLNAAVPDTELVSRLYRTTPHDVPQREFRGPF
ncbi:alpha-ketoacid dehydrogenase subunit beta [Candidatus Methylospira mobilis]|uniref:Alpha-ketoacid dehydrogenase subunit beta n=1 Tax=Candidatus Methylospira mobilis TaxID=1808979 RepID=A0A5Q0BI42_9GAMM|nr:transketolase C-terminal domain-containing protein [Candidatus Methylospira mobilis]QFY41871.1 alpha-ketoacid dehydrogenase subunit beta [Candidatus Methylospira mobilis]WNV06748.1 transketolase C-terminal domain-containing protein [Candidatus Methylospira mobilis]